MPLEKHIINMNGLKINFEEEKPLVNDNALDPFDLLKEYPVSTENSIGILSGINKGKSLLKYMAFPSFRKELFKLQKMSYRNI